MVLWDAMLTSWSIPRAIRTSESFLVGKRSARTAALLAARTVAPHEACPIILAASPKNVLPVTDLASVVAAL